MASAGYISSFDNLDLTINATPDSAIGDTNKTLARMFTLPNGDVVNYDGTTDPNSTPDKCEQKYHIYNNGLSRYNLITAKKHHRGDAVKTKFSGGTETAKAILEDVRIDGLHKEDLGAISITLYFKMETDWT